MKFEERDIQKFAIVTPFNERRREVVEKKWTDAYPKLRDSDAFQWTKKRGSIQKFAIVTPFYEGRKEVVEKSSTASKEALYIYIYISINTYVIVFCCTFVFPFFMFWKCLCFFFLFLYFFFSRFWQALGMVVEAFLKVIESLQRCTAPL